MASRPDLAWPTGSSAVDQLDAQRAAEGRTASATYLVETAFLNERMKAQRGAFAAGRIPADPAVGAWSSLDLTLVEPEEERHRIDRLLNPTRGRPPARGERPLVIAFRIRGTVRRALRAQLAERFGYTTETIYPNLNGFARAFDQYAPIRDVDPSCVLLPQPLRSAAPRPSRCAQISASSATWTRSCRSSSPRTSSAPRTRSRPSCPPCSKAVSGADSPLASS